MLTTFPSELEMIDFYHESKNILKQAGFVLREWHSNSPKLNALDASDLDDECKILGLLWDKKKDCLSLPPQNFKLSDLTKRVVVGEVAKIYDVMGYFLPITVLGRTYIQNLWKDKIPWDKKLKGERVAEWQQLAHSFSDLSNICIPRQVKI